MKEREQITRRGFLGHLAALSAFTVVGCGNATDSGSALVHNPGGGDARIAARVSAPTSTSVPGSYLITESRPLDGSLLIPSSYSATRSMPLMIGLHGAGQSAASQVAIMGGLAESSGFLYLAVGARGITWDVFSSKYSYDVTFISDALKWTFARCNVNSQRIAIEGFSDGASYTLGLALANGDLFTHAIAFSPGFVPPSDSPAVGKPRFFDSHGRQDSVLSIDAASRVIVPSLKNAGYDVTYQEFDGNHQVPATIAAQAAAWFLG